VKMGDAGFLSSYRIEKGPWQALERATARLFQHLGWPYVALIGGAGDHGGDIIVSDDDEEFVIQVKFKKESATLVNKGAITELKEAMDFYTIPKGYIVTNSRLSSTANDYIYELNKTGYSIEKLEGNSLFSYYSQLLRFPDIDYTPYPYQVQVIDSLWGTYSRGTKKSMVILATGLGKTFVAGTFIKRVLHDKPNARILILANQRALLNQFDRALWKHLPKDVSTHIWDSNEKPAYDEGITLATFQTMRNAIIRDDFVGDYEVVIVDEAHHAPSETYLEVIEKLNKRFLLGMTATPWRTDEKELYDVFGNPCKNCVIDIVKALQNGYLSKVDYRLLCDNLDWNFIQTKSRKKYSIKDLNKRLFLPERDEKVIEQIQKIWAEISPKRAIIYCASISHAKRMENTLREFGFSARCIHSDLDFRESERRLREFRRGKIQILTSMNMLNEGIDVPEVDLIIFLRVTHSRIIFLQQLGRGLRLSEGKEKVVVLDFVADIKRIAETIDIADKVYGERDQEVLKDRFNMQFSVQDAKTFFEEYLKDKAAIQEYSEDDTIVFPA